MVDFCLVPIGVGVSVSPYVVQCQKVLTKSGLSHQLHAFGTSVEGEWDEVMAVIQECHEQVHSMGAPRIHTNVKIGTRVDKAQSLSDKIQSVQEKLND